MRQHSSSPVTSSLISLSIILCQLQLVLSNEQTSTPKAIKTSNKNWVQRQPYESPVISELKIQTTASPETRPSPAAPLDTCPILNGYKSAASSSSSQSKSSCSHQTCAATNPFNQDAASGQKQLTTPINRYKQNLNSWARVQTNEHGKRHFNASIVGVFSCASELDPSNDLTLDIRLAKPAIDLAIKAAKRSYSKYINFRVSYRSTPDICKHQQAGGHAAEEFFVNGATYFVGPGCSESLSSMGQLASYWRVPMCSTGHVPEIEAYRFKPMTMIQLSLSIQSVGEMFLELFRRYNWHHLVIVTDEKHPLHSIIRNGLLDFFITYERTSSKSTGFDDDSTTTSTLFSNGPKLEQASSVIIDPLGSASSRIVDSTQAADFMISSNRLKQANDNWRRQNYRIPQQNQQLFGQKQQLLLNSPLDLVNGQPSATSSGASQPGNQAGPNSMPKQPAPSVQIVPYVKAQGLIYKERVVSNVADNGARYPTIVREVDYEQTILEASNHSHIMLLLAASDTVRQLLKAAHKHQMSWGQYVFLAHELFGNIKMDQEEMISVAGGEQQAQPAPASASQSVEQDLSKLANKQQLMPDDQHQWSESLPAGSVVVDQQDFASSNATNGTTANENSDGSGGDDSASENKCPFNLSNFGDKLNIDPIPEKPDERRLIREMYSPLILISLKIPFSNHFGSFIQEVARLSEQEFNHCIDMTNLKSVYSLGVAALVYDCVMLYAYGAAHLIQHTNSSTIDGETLFDWTANRNFESKLTGNLSVNRAGQRVIDFSLNTFINDSFTFEPRAHFNAMRKQLEFLPNRSTYWEALAMEPPSSDPHCRLGDPFACQYVDSQTMRDAFSSGGRFVLGIWLLVALVLSVALTSSLVGWLIYRRFRIESELLNLWWSIKYEDIIFEDDAEALQDVKRSMSSLAISQDSFAQNSLLAPPQRQTPTRSTSSQQGSNQNITSSSIELQQNVSPTQQHFDNAIAAPSPLNNAASNNLGQQLVGSTSGRASPSTLSKNLAPSHDQNQCSTSVGPVTSIMSANNQEAGSTSHQQHHHHHHHHHHQHHDNKANVSNAHSVSSLTQSVCSNQGHSIKQLQNQVTQANSASIGNSIGKFSNCAQQTIQSGSQQQTSTAPPLTTTSSTNNKNNAYSSTSAVSTTTAPTTTTTNKYNKKITQSSGGNRSNAGCASTNLGSSGTGANHQDSGRRRQHHEAHHHKDPSISSQNKNVKLKLGTVLNGGRDQQFATKVGLYKASRVAAKHLNVKNLNINRQLLIELRQVRDLTHENLIKFIGLCPEEPNVAIVSELCTRGNLQDLLQNDTIRLDWSFRYSIINDIVDGLQHLHSSPIQHHGRLKSSNCVIDNRFVVKLTDFGLPSLLASVELDEQVVNPRHLLWTAPEHLRTKHPLLSGSAKGDIYSLAIIFQEIITRCGPFECEPILCASAQAATAAAAAAAASSGAVMVDTPLVRISPGQTQSSRQPQQQQQAKQQPKLYSNANQQQQQQQAHYQPMVMVQHKQRLEPDEIVNLVRMGLSPPFRPYFRPDLVATGGNGTSASQQQASDGFNLADLIALVQGCWQEQPASRPSIGSVKQQIKKTRRGHHLEGSNLMDNLLQRMERYTDNLESLVEQKTAELTEEKKRSEELLYEMLPRFVVDQLRYGHSVTPEAYEAVTIGFSDIKDFTSISAQSSPIEVVNLLNQLYTEFDDCIAQYDVYKVETIGDAYMVVSGLPIRNGDQHASEIAEMSLALLDLIRDFEIVHLPEVKLELRIGIHSGPCASGVVGTKMFRYCLFGDTVNTASRMESHGEPMKIHISEDSAQILGRFGTFVMEPRGQVDIKGKGLMSTYWLLGKRDQLAPNYQAS